MINKWSTKFGQLLCFNKNAIQWWDEFDCVVEAVVLVILFDQADTDGTQGYFWAVIAEILCGSVVSLHRQFHAQKLPYFIRVELNAPSTEEKKRSSF